ncbi:hypothetical protein B0H12DRAFT_50292 [Mycena haematopus]|nr:hypothetical protein B0H12DRAFT_50292 [Mycena haematopus]
MSVKPAPGSAVQVQAHIGGQLPSLPLLLPAASRRDDFNSNVYVDDNGMQDQAQQFLDTLKLRPFIKTEATDPRISFQFWRTSSIASSTRSSHNEILESAVGENVHVVEEAGVPYVAGASRASSPESDNMIISSSPERSPIPGLMTLPIVEYSNPDKPVDVQHAPGERDRPAIQQLSLALEDVRKKIKTNLLKEQAIFLALKNLNVDTSELIDPSFDHSSLENNFSETPHDRISLKIELTSIKVAKVKVEMLKADLENMVARCEAVGQSVKQIAKERRPPFTNPALMDAFVGVSRLSTQVLYSDK